MSLSRFARPLPVDVAMPVDPARRLFTARTGWVLSAGALALLAGCDTVAAQKKSNAAATASDVDILNSALAAEHQGIAAGRIQEPREHLQRGRLAGTVRAEEADDLPRADVEGDPLDGAHVACLASNECFRGGTEPGLALGHLVDLRKLGDVDDRVGHGLQAIYT